MMLISVAETSGSGSPDIKMLGNGFGDILISDMLALQFKDPRFAKCKMAILEWRRRADAQAELDLIYGRFGEKYGQKKPVLPMPQYMIEGTISEAAGAVRWAVTMKNRETGAVVTSSEGSVDKERVFESLEVASEDLMKKICEKGWTISGGGARITVTGQVSRLDAPFVAKGEFPGGTADFVYTPTSDKGGTVSYTLAGGGVTGAGEGTYTIAEGQEGAYTINQTTKGCINGVPNSCRTNSETLTLTPD